MRLLEKVHPALATWFALKLFFTPLKFPIPHREKEIRGTARLHGMSTGKSAFSVFEWGEGEKRVLLVHGWSGRATQFFKIIERLLAEGYHVYSIEAPAHGDSSQRKTHMLEFVQAIEKTNEAFGPFQIAVGHSLGGMAIFNAMKQEGFKPETVTVIGSPASIENVVMDFCRKVEASQAIGKRIIRYIEERYDMKVCQASTEYLAKQFDPQGIIVHDNADSDVGIKNAYELKDQWSNAEILVTDGLGHRKILMKDQVIDKIMDFFNNR